MEDLTGDDILALVDRPIEPLDIPEWGGRVYIRGVSAAEMDALHARGKNGRVENFHAHLAALLACDADGNRLFTAEQTEALGRKLYKPIRRIVEAGERLNGQVDVKKKSAPANGRDSGSTLQGRSEKRSKN